MIKFALVLSSRYPSEKAYAVTTKETAHAANEAGFQTLIFAPSDVSDGNVISLNNRAIVFLSKFIGTNFLASGKIIFQLRRIMIAKEFRKLNRIDKNSRVIWTRDPIVALLTPKDQKLVLELHHKQSKFDSQLCKALNSRRNLVICTLTKSHRDDLQLLFASHEVVIAPMAVNKDFFLKEKQLCDSEQIVFLGKGRSSGHDNNLVKVIQELAIYRNSFNLDLRFCFLGLEDDYQTELQREIENYDLNNEKVTFTSHVQHDQVPKLLNDVSIGLIPYENTPYNNQRFPIKAVEYAAARVTILATDIPIHKEILGVDFCYFYSPDVPGDLCRALTEIFDDSQDRQKKIQKAQEWAYEHTYLNRVNVVLNSLSGLS